MNATDVLRYGHRTVLESLEGLPPVRWQDPGVVGVWSVKDVLAHLASFERVLVEVLESLAGAEPGPLLDRFRSSEGFNGEEVAARAESSPEAVLDEYIASFERVLARVERLDGELLRQPGLIPWYGPGYSLDDFIVYAFYGHKREHGAQLKLFRRKVLAEEHRRAA